MGDGHEFSGRVMVVDDEIAVCKMLEMFFERGGYDVETTTDPAQTAAMYEKFRPDIVLLDLLMPEIDGISVLKRIKEIDESAKVIIISGLQDIGMAKEALMHGAIDYFTKPIQLDNLDDWIQMELKRDRS